MLRAENKRFKKISVIIPYLWIVLGFVFDLFVQIVYGERLLDSDMASDMVLSNLLNKEGRLITSSFCYSTEIKVINVQSLYRIPLLIFPNDWHMARIIGSSVGLLLMVVLWLRLSKALNLKEAGPWIAAFMVFPGGYWYFWQTIYGNYYLTYIIFSIVSILLLVKAVGAKNKWARGIYIALSLAISFASGLNGIKQMMVCYAPLFLATVIFFLVEREKISDKISDLSVEKVKACDTSTTDADESNQQIKNSETNIFIAKNKTYLAYIVISIFMVLSNFCGYLVNSKILSSRYTFKSYAENNWNSKSILDMAVNFIKSYGYNDGSALFSLRGIAAGLGLLVGMGVVFSAVRLGIRYKDLSFYDKLLYVISITEIIMTILVFSFLNGATQYYQPIVMFGLFLVGLEIKNERFELRYSRGIVWNLFATIYFIASVGSVKEQLNNPMRAVEGHMQVVEWLMDNGYTKGIALFWNANVVTELSNGKIEMWQRDADEGYWLQEKEKAEKLPDGRAFFLFYTPGYEVDPSWSIYEYVDKGEGYEVYRDDTFTIYEINGDLLQ